MRKIVVCLLLLAACKGSTRRYVNHTEGPYSIADDTLIIQDSFIINRTGYQKIRNGQVLPKQFQYRQWGQHSRDLPLIRFDGQHAFWNNTIYLQIP